MGKRVHLRVVLPDRYPFAENVPKEGASCATCIFLTEDEEHCLNKFYVKAHGSNELGDEANVWCCMAWSAEKRKKG